MNDEQKIRDALAETYLPEGVDIWLSATHKGGLLSGRCPNDMIANGEADKVLAAAESLSGQIAT